MLFCHKALKRLQTINNRNIYIAGLLAGISLSVTTQPVFAGNDSIQQGDTVVVTATRLATPSNKVGSSVYVITGEDIEIRQYRSVGEALQSIPSLSVIRSGGAGKLVDVFSRGSNANHTLVLIDGIEINDASTPDGRIDLSHIYIGDVERIEVLLGPQSTLYGSDAIGSVIQIFTKKGQGKPVASATLEGGSFDTFNQYASVRGSHQKLSYSLNLQHTDTDGHSDLSSDFRQPNGVLDDDGHENMTVSSRLVFNASDTLEFDFSGRYIDSESDLDLNVFPVQDDSDSESEADQLFLGLQTRLSLFDGRTDHRLGITYTNIDRSARDDFDPVNSFDFLRDNNKSTKIKIDLQNDFYLSDAHTLTLGLETEEDDIESDLVSDSLFGSFSSSIDDDVRNNAVYLQDQFAIGEQLSGTAGIRHDDHEDFGNETTWRIAAAYLLPGSNTKLKGSYATGFKAPTLFQLFGVSTFFIGNPDLDAETSKGWEIGVEQELEKINSRLGVTYYRNDIDDLIAFEGGTNVNLDEVETYGVEAFLDTRFSEQASAGLDYSYTRAVDQDTDKNLLRRPLHKAVAHFDYKPLNNLSLSAEGIFIGNRYDIDAASFARIRRGSYFIANLSAAYTVNSQWELFGRVDNLLDRDYEEPAGFEQPDAAVYVGFKVNTD